MTNFDLIKKMSKEQVALVLTIAATGEAMEAAPDETAPENVREAYARVMEILDAEIPGV